MNKHNYFQSPLSKAKGLGSSNSGSATWWAQRVSAVALVPLVFWFAYFILNTIKNQSPDEFLSIFASPFPTILLALFLGVGIYHGNIGIKEIIEDYVHCHKLKIASMIAVQFISIVTAIAGICALLVFHLSTFSFN
jgi:succinate dehydrogenase / fumarate reductase, membrane anchor subunit